MRLAPLLCCLLLAGCRSCRDAAPGAEQGGARFRRCATLDPSGRETRTVAGRELRRDGYTLHDPRRGTGTVVLALLGGPHGSSPGDPRLARLGARLARAHAVAVLGGLHGDAASLGPWLDAVVPRHTPTLLVPADTEDHGAFRAALATLREGRPEVIDGTRVRHYTSVDLELVTVPGTAWPGFGRRDGEGCALSPGDVRALASALPAPRAPRILVTASAPAQRGAAAIDLGVLGQHVGSRELADALPALRIRGLAALLPRESAGALATLQGVALPAPSIGPEGFSLSTGAASSDPFETSGGALLGPVAWLVEISRDGVRVERVDP